MFKIRHLLLAAVVVALPLTLMSAPALAGGSSCCCPPPVKVALCVVDPCTCCKTTVCVCVPACCADQEVHLTCCRRGLFGRHVLTYTWGDCCHSVDVLVKRNGAVKVR